MGDLVAITGKLEKLIPRLGTDADGEIIATVRAIGRALQSNGCDWHDLAAAVKGEARPPRRKPSNELHRMALWLMQNALDQLSDHSRDFVATMALKLARQKPTAKQERYLRDLYEQNCGPK